MTEPMNPSRGHARSDGDVGRPALAMVRRVAKAVEAEYMAIAMKALRGGAIGFSRTDKDHIRIARAAINACAAAELLSALEGAIQHEGDTRHPPWWIEPARAAIAKALGADPKDGTI